MAFEIARTNLVIELGIILALLMGWQFTLAEFVGGPVMIVVLAVLFRLFLRRRLLAEAARRRPSGAWPGRWRATPRWTCPSTRAARSGGGCAPRQGSPRPPHLRDGVGRGLRDIVGWAAHRRAFAAWVPDSFWRRSSSAATRRWPKIWGPLVGPLVAVVSFVCSIGNVPLAAVLWNGGISFGGVVAFIFADLIILPILVIYRKYYGTAMVLFLLATFYVDDGRRGLRRRAGLRRHSASCRPRRTAKVVDSGISWNYTTWLNIAFLILAAALVRRFCRTGGVPMLRMMGGGPEDAGHGGHAHDPRRPGSHT